MTRLVGFARRGDTLSQACGCDRSERCQWGSEAYCERIMFIDPAEIAALEIRLTDAKLAAERLRDLTEESDQCPDCRDIGECCEKHGELFTEAWGRLNKALGVRSWDGKDGQKRKGDEQQEATE